MINARFLVVIPARYGSTRFPGKPMAEINGIPMVKRVYDIVKDDYRIKGTIIATEDSKILEYCKSIKLNVIMTNAEHLTGTDRLGEVSGFIQSPYYINLQGDEPLFEFENLLLGMDSVEHHPNIIVNFATKLENFEVNNTSVVKVCVNKDGFVEKFFRSPEDICCGFDYYRHLGIYIIPHNVLANFSNLQRSKNEMATNAEMYRFIDNGYKIKLIIIETKSIAVDHPEDIFKVERILNSK
jgi:3-deoxy-manno-octulosonate cytidylyltransferase (CMP-KDO synthetase)